MNSSESAKQTLKIGHKSINCEQSNEKLYQKKKKNVEGKNKANSKQSSTAISFQLCLIVIWIFL